MSDDLAIDADGVKVRVTGLRDTLRSLEKAGNSAEDLKTLMASLSQIVISAANPPRGPTGKLSASIRPGRGKTKAVIRAGGARTPYAGVVHYGWPERGISPNPFLVDAVARTRSQIHSQLEQGIEALLKDSKLT